MAGAISLQPVSGMEGGDSLVQLGPTSQTICESRLEETSNVSMALPTAIICVWLCFFSHGLLQSERKVQNGPKAAENASGFALFSCNGSTSPTELAAAGCKTRARRGLWPAA